MKMILYFLLMKKENENLTVSGLMFGDEKLVRGMRRKVVFKCVSFFFFFSSNI